MMQPTAFATVVRYPPRLRAVAKPEASAPALDALLSAGGAIGARQHAAGVAYAALRERHDRAKHGGGGLAPDLWAVVKRDHAGLLAAAGFERFAPDRVCLDGEAPLRCEVGRVRAALGRAATSLRYPRARQAATGCDGQNGIAPAWGTAGRLM